MGKQTNYTVVSARRAGMISELIDKVKALQRKGWVCQGGMVIGNPGAESSCYQAMAKSMEKNNEKIRSPQNEV